MIGPRAILAPEVVQTSNLDCGPASLKCLLEGFGIRASYGRLREACQTGVDGTSIDTMEMVARQLGLDAEQVLVPIDHVLALEGQALPAIVVVRLPTGLTHFVVVWRRHGGLLQVMDPATGRRWPSCERFLREVYIHATPAPASDWLEFARSSEFQNTLDRRMKDLGISASAAARVRTAASSEWRTLAALDAATRLTAALVSSKAVPNGRGALRLVERFTAKPDAIPARYWSARPQPGEQVLLRGAVLVRVRGKLPAPVAASELPRELAAALDERPAHPLRELIALLGQSGQLSPWVIVVALAVAAGGALIEVVLFRGLFDLGHELGMAGQRAAAVGAILIFSGALFFLEWPIFSSVLRLGRQIENRLRVAFLDKIPRLGDRYFQSRLTSDMAERSHTTQRLRHLPDLGRQLLRSVFELCATAVGIVWLDPASAPLVLLAVAGAILPPFALQTALAERDLRLRSHAAALTRYYLDAMLGLIPIRAHGAERAVRRQHEQLLEKWAAAAFALQRTVLRLEAFQLVTIFGLVAWLLLSRLAHGAEVGRILLMIYWALNIPTLGQDIGALARQFPYYRNLTLRLLEPLGAPEEPEFEAGAAETDPPALEVRGVTVQGGGHIILQDIDLLIHSREQIGILGPSGAGKSSLVGVLLGWLRPSQGEVLVNGQPLNCESLRRSLAWVDPAVQLWNRSLLDNLRYGNDPSSATVENAMQAASLRDVLERLPDGLQTSLGEGGATLSGGQGQRVRLGRAMLRPDAGLVILDEPFRGLDRQRRRELLAEAREYWKGATLLCITHDVDETRAFDRVLVIEHGRIVEDGAPRELAAIRGSRYARMLDAETDVRTGMWSGSQWRRFRVESGHLATGQVTKSSARDRELMDLL